MTRVQTAILGLSMVVVAATVFVLWLMWFSIGPSLATQYLKHDFALVGVSGTIGDAFGPLNALFAAFGFIGVMMTLVLQGFAIKNQQVEIKRAQVDLRKQQFDANFFKLLELMRELRSEIAYQPFPDMEELKGSAALRAAYQDARRYLQKKAPMDRPLSRVEIANIYGANIHKNSEDGLGPYFRVIYTILKRIDEDAALLQNEKIKYGNLLRGQFGSPEIGLISLNGLTKQSKDLAYYLNKYRILRYLPEGFLKKTIAPHYDRDAFDPRDD